MWLFLEKAKAARRKLIAAAAVIEGNYPVA